MNQVHSLASRNSTRTDARLSERDFCESKRGERRWCGWVFGHSRRPPNATVNTPKCRRFAKFNDA